MMKIISTIALAGLLATTAQARIICRDGFQVVRGQEISTPYCNDNRVAAVARRHGFRVSDAEIRNNPARKDEVCRFISSNIEVRDYCNTSEGRERGR